MEDTNVKNKEGVFTNLPNTQVTMATANNTGAGSKAARVNSNDPIDPMTMVQVNKGDELTLEAWAYYEGDGSTDGVIDAVDLLTVCGQ